MVIVPLLNKEQWLPSSNGGVYLLTLSPDAFGDSAIEGRPGTHGRRGTLTYLRVVRALSSFLGCCSGHCKVRGHPSQEGRGSDGGRKSEKEPRGRRGWYSKDPTASGDAICQMGIGEKGASDQIYRSTSDAPESAFATRTSTTSNFTLYLIIRHGKRELSDETREKRHPVPDFPITNKQTAVLPGVGECARRRRGSQKLHRHSAVSWPS